ncbi:hypothetical protein [Streptomyces aureus]
MATAAGWSVRLGWLVQLLLAPAALFVAVVLDCGPRDEVHAVMNAVVEPSLLIMTVGRPTVGRTETDSGDGQVRTDR